jgi:hypothetical protein
MKIYIRDERKRRYFIPAPIWLVKAGLSIGLRIAEKHVPEEQRCYFRDIDLKELRKGIDVLKAYKGLNLVDVRAKDGTEVRIIV